ncbi:MAG: bifunctional diaminohydroxyphosphoribosylaminopyrimidine deaminase/5-amino-6-(5-phosphoribosylamino)uracil reductase RibD [Bacteroidetes bacterium]|nr:bifunctional diaminohydroxyphosphoribosylaminopyrimidine deaminase/5-amino-6-(5-phosphoribosylamino)uracil reductase RibD [Bacteroidota bacterium]
MSEGSVAVFEHEFWMRRCLALAERGWGRVSPNPMVGAVLVRGGDVLGEGWHAIFGGAHAERMLFEGLGTGLNEDFSDCILYVTLEPCAHFGKTPPCANLILEKGVGAVVVGVLDPNPKVSGLGVEILRAAGVEVLLGVLAEECRRLNGSFWVNQVLGRSAVVSKWAETGDGFMGRVSDERVLISGQESGRWVHHLRSGMDAILVGVNTWNSDLPKLNVRGLEVSKQPIRIVLDRRLRGEYSAEALNRSGAPLWVIYDLNFLESDEAMGIRELQFQSLSEASGSEKLVGWGLDFAEVALEQKNLDNWIEKLLQWFYEAHGLGVILVEGGASILQSFLDADCVDEIHILRNSQMRLESGVMSPNLDRGMLYRDADFGSDEHWVWQRKVGGVSIETGEGDRAE